MNHIDLILPANDYNGNLYLGGIKSINLEYITEYRLKSILSVCGEIKLCAENDILSHRSITIEDQPDCDLK